MKKSSLLLRNLTPSSAFAIGQDAASAARTTREIGHVDYLDGWRGLAIIFLLIGHFFPVKGIDVGVFGVEMFFVLSGLLMTRLLLIKKIPITIFYKRRISRIFPVFYLFLLTTTFLYVVDNRTIVAPELIAATFFANNYFTDIGHETMPLGHIWSLSVEEHSYLLLSLIAIASVRHYKKSVVLIGALCAFSIGVGVYYWLHPGTGSSKYTEVAAFGIFASGLMMLGMQNISTPRLPWIVYPGLVVAALALQWWSVPSPIKHFVGVSLLAMTINLLDNAPRQVTSALSFSPLRKLGLWSFSIYVWQQPFFLMVDREGSLPGWAGVIFSLCAGMISYQLYEMPIRNHLNATWAKFR